ncbi:MAG: hypothetical protein WAU86_18040, partial [Oricola sp.]
MIVIDCDDVAPRDRFDHWVHACRSAFYPVEVTSCRDKELPFSARVEFWQAGNAMISRQTTNPYIGSRTRRTIDERAVDLCVIGCSRIGTIDTSHADIPDMHCAAGDLILMDSDTEWTTRPRQDLDIESIMFPRALLAPYLGERRLRAQLVDTSQPLHGMLHAMFREFMKLREHPASISDGAAQVLVHLIATAHGLSPSSGSPVGQSFNEARLVQATQFITANYYNPRLNAQAVAAHLGVSVRRLHALYEPTGGSVARQILATRIERAKEML